MDFGMSSDVQDCMEKDDVYSCTLLKLQKELHQRERVRLKVLQQHNESIHSLESELKGSRDSESALYISISTLQTEISQLRSECQQINIKYENHIADSMKSKQMYEISMDQLNKALEYNDAIISQQKQEINQLYQDKRCLQEEISMLQTQLQTSQTILQQTLTVVREQSEEISSEKELVLNHSNEIMLLKKKLEYNDKKVGILTSEIESATTKIADITESKQALYYHLNAVVCMRNRLATWCGHRTNRQNHVALLLNIFLDWKAKVQNLKLVKIHKKEVILSEQSNRLGLRKLQLQAQLTNAINIVYLAKKELELQRKLVIDIKNAIDVEILPIELIKQLQTKYQLTNRHKYLASKFRAIILAKIRINRIAVLEYRQRGLERFLVKQCNRIQCSYVLSLWKERYHRQIINETTHAVMLSDSHKVSEQAVITSLLHDKMSTMMDEDVISENNLLRDKKAQKWTRWRRTDRIR